MSAEVAEFHHQFFPIGFPTAEALKISSSSEDELASVIELHVKSSDYAVLADSNSIIFSIINFISDLVEAFETKVKLDAFVKLLVNHFMLVEISWLKKLN